jgi:hypothetical protein
LARDVIAPSVIVEAVIELIAEVCQMLNLSTGERLAVVLCVAYVLRESYEVFLRHVIPPPITPAECEGYQESYNSLPPPLNPVPSMGRGLTSVIHHLLVRV